MSNKITLGSVCKLQGGSGFPEQHQGRSEGDFPFIKVSDMTIAGNHRYIRRATNYVNQSLVNRLRLTIFPKDTVVFAKVGAALLLNRRRILIKETVIDNNMMGAIPVEINCEFLNYVLQSVDFKNFVQSGAVPSVNQALVGSISLTNFPLPQQKKIARILTTIDNLIEKTEALIAKYKSIKQGMMNDLFTRGVDQNGRLRPPYEQAPHLYKDSELGKIPIEWEIGKLRTFTEKVCVGFVGTCEPFYTDISGVKMLRTGNLQNGELDLSDMKYVTSTFHSSNKKSQVRVEDVLIARHGTSGQAILVPEGFGEANCLNIVIVRPSLKFYSPIYLKQLFNSDVIRQQIDRKKAGSTQSVVNTSEIIDCYFICPTLTEQRHANATLNSIDETICKGNASLTKYDRLKSGLMQDLLTGKVRVNVDELEEELTSV